MHPRFIFFTTSPSSKETFIYHFFGKNFAGNAKMTIEKLEKKYASIVGYTQASSSDNHGYFMQIVNSIRKGGANGSSLGILDKIGDYYAELAPIVRASEMEKRWNPSRRDAQSNHSSKYATDDKNRRSEEPSKCRRQSDKPSEYNSHKNSIDHLRHEGKEEFLASVIYSITVPKKGEKFAQSFFNKKDISNLKLIGSYYTGPFSGNNTLFDTLLLSGSAGKKIAPQIASTLEKITSNEVMSKAIYDIRSIVSEAARMYYLSSKGEFTSYMDRLKKQNPALYHEAEVEDPRTLLIYAGNVQNGTTFMDRLNILKDEAKIGFGVLDKNGKQIKPMALPTKTSKGESKIILEERRAK